MDTLVSVANGEFELRNGFWLAEKVIPDWSRRRH
jgi:hypothetical protein